MGVSFSADASANMSFSYDRYDRQRRARGPSAQRTATNYWIPLGITVATTAIGLAIWAWNERKDYVEDTSSDDDHHDDPYARSKKSKYKRSSRRELDPHPPENVIESLEVKGPEGPEAVEQQQETVFSRMSGAIKRTPSPQILFDGASKRVAAGVAAAGAAAGAVVGRGLSSLKESDDDFQDHERWSAEAETRSVETGVVRAGQTKRKRMIAVVVSAAGKSDQGEVNPEYEIEHASILSHLPLHIDSEAVDLLVLIYAPDLTSYPLLTQASSGKSKARTASSTSSFSNISASAIEDETAIDESATPAGYYAAIQAAALRLVPHPTHIIPFTTPTGHVHLLRHLSPSLVYVQEELCGLDGENIKQIEGWVGQIVVVIGESLAADTETEDEGNPVSKAPGSDWWKDSSRVGLGKAEVVESMRFEEDWMKRVGA